MYWSDWLLTMAWVAVVRRLALQASQLLSDICRKILRVGIPYYEDYYCTQAGFSGLTGLSRSNGPQVASEAKR